MQDIHEKYVHSIWKFREFAMNTPYSGAFFARAVIETPLGHMLLAATRQGLAGAWFTQDQKDCPDIGIDIAPCGAKNLENPILRQVARELDDYFEKGRRIFDVPLDLSSGTPFRQIVWRALLDIPLGQTSSYGQIAAATGRPQAARAVGAAVGANPLSIIVPCHRVLAGDGSLNGYAGGLRRKLALLMLEGWELPALADLSDLGRLKLVPPVATD